MAYILLKNARLWDAQSPEILENAWVLINGNLIEQVSATPIECSQAKVIDLQGKTLMPGLIDAHVHVTATEIDLANDYIPSSLVTAQAAAFMEDMLMRGFTSVRDAGGADMGLAQAVATDLIKGPRLFYCGKALSQTGGHGDFRKPNIDAGVCACPHSGSNISRIADGVHMVREAARDEIRRGANHIKIMASGGVASPTDRVTNLQYSLEEIEAIVEEAQDAGIYVMAHAYTAEAIMRCVKAGVRTIEHGNRLTEEAAKLMVEKEAYLVPTLVIYEALANLGPKLNYPPESLAKIEDVRTLGLEAIKIARKTGLKIGFGTDLLGVEGQKWQAKEFVIRAQVESPYDTLTSATRINAEILNQVDKLGVIKPGAFADLIVVNQDPFKDISLLAGQGEALDLIMKNGVVYKNRL